jgi:predicted O-linked N-acetylglucosamine transferase (SPINDLY family)
MTSAESRIDPSAAPASPATAELSADALLALAAYRQGKWEEAENFGRRALTAQANAFEVLHLLGIIALREGRLAEANELLARAVNANPKSADAQNSRGAALRAIGRHEEAQQCYDRAISLRPDHAGAHLNSGTLWGEMNEHVAALACFDTAIRIRPDLAEAHYNRGVALASLGRHQDAIASYDRTIALRPDFVSAHHNRASSLADLRRHLEALHGFERALQLRPSHAYLFGAWLFAKLRICDWTEIDSQLVLLTQKLERREKATRPFLSLVALNSPASQRLAAEVLVADKYPGKAAHPGFPGIVSHVKHDRIRVGYFSADFHEHATCHLIAGLLERHDRRRFEVFAFSFGLDRHDAMRTRVSAACDGFIDITRRSDADVARLSREMEIDIAVDLKGFTEDCRTGIFARRAAPVQVSYLGYPGTMGADYIDYLVADRTVIPETERKHYSEKIAYLPDSYQVNDSKRTILDRSYTRQQLGLPLNGFVYCCFNNVHKILPGMFDVWMRILLRVEGSVLWLLDDNEWATNNLRTEASRRGVDPKRLVFAQRIAAPDHLARHRVADLVLDTLPYNAHTTASDALWAGVPVLTRCGETFAGRVAASLLRAVGLTELVAHTEHEYEETAVELANAPRIMCRIRDHLTSNRSVFPLFDTDRFAANLENLYIVMHERRCAGLPPDHIAV